MLARGAAQARVSELGVICAFYVAPGPSTGGAVAATAASRRSDVGGTRHAPPGRTISGSAERRLAWA
eukprot:1147255-Prymnesium_polylepis.1